MMEQITFSYEIVVGICTFIFSIAAAWYANKGQISVLELRINTLEKEITLLNNNLTVFENKWGSIADTLAVNSTKALHEIEKINMYIQGQEGRFADRFTAAIERISALEKHERG